MAKKKTSSEVVRESTIRLTNGASTTSQVLELGGVVPRSEDQPEFKIFPWPGGPSVLDAVTVSAAYFRDNQTVSLTTTANPGTERSLDLYFRSLLDTNARAVLHVVQEARVFSLSENSLSFGGAGASKAILVSSSMGDFSTLSASLSGDASVTEHFKVDVLGNRITVTADSNEDVDNPREVSLVVSLSDLPEQTVSVSQGAGVSYQLVAVAPTAPLPASGGSTTVTTYLDTYSGGSLLSRAEVVSILSLPSGVVPGWVVSGGRVTANNRGSELGPARSVTLVASYMVGGVTVISDPFSVTQAANEVELSTSVSLGGLEVSPQPFPGNAGSGSMYVEGSELVRYSSGYEGRQPIPASSIVWSVNDSGSGTSWLSVSEGQVGALSYTANPGSMRRAILNATYGSISVGREVTQGEGSITIVGTPSVMGAIGFANTSQVGVSPTVYTLRFPTGRIELNQAATSAGVYSLNLTQDSSSGDYTLSVMPYTNLGSASRTLAVSFSTYSSDGVFQGSQSIALTQAATQYGRLIVKFPSDISVAGNSIRVSVCRWGVTAGGSAGYRDYAGSLINLNQFGLTGSDELTVLLTLDQINAISSASSPSYIDVTPVYTGSGSLPITPYGSIGSYGVDGTFSFSESGILGSGSGSALLTGTDLVRSVMPVRGAVLYSAPWDISTAPRLSLSAASNTESSQSTFDINLASSVINQGYFVYPACALLYGLNFIGYSRTPSSTTNRTMFFAQRTSAGQNTSPTRTVSGTTASFGSGGPLASPTVSNFVRYPFR